MSERAMIGLVVGIVALAMLVGGVVGVVVVSDRPAPTRTPSAAATHASRTGPTSDDYVPIDAVLPETRPVPAVRTVTAECGNNENGHYNSDNVIVSPGIRNGAHHLHDYVGNTATSATSTDADLARAGTTCADRGDTSSYFWPVLRDRTDVAGQERVAGEDPADGNVGRVLRPRVTLTFAGNRYAPVVAPPRLLRVLTGDAKALTNGGRNARARWTCTGYEDRVTADRYPLCPLGRGLTRILRFPSCWNGHDLDSANHRAHLRFSDESGRCAAGSVPIPELTMTLVYDVPAGPSYAVDSFPDQGHAPATDHADFLALHTPESSARLVRCLNTGC